MSDAPQHWRKAVVSGVACLVPSDEGTDAWLKRRKIGAAVAMNPDHVRNAERSALYWVICSIVADTHSELTTREEVSDAIKLLSGHVHISTVTMPDGERVFLRRPRSIAFAKMEEPEFESYLERALRVIETQLLPGCDIEELRKDAYLRAGVSR